MEQTTPSVMYSPEKAAYSKEFTEDFTLPDFAVDITRVIDICTVATVSGSVIENGRLTVCGKLSYTVLYLSDKDTDLHKASFQSEYCDYFDCSGTDVTSCRIFAKEPFHKLIGSRKIQIRSVCDFSYIYASVSPMPETEIREDLQFLKKEKKCFFSKTIEAKTLRISEDIGIPGSLPEISEVLFAFVNIANTNAEQSNGKAVISGDAELCFIYADTEQGIQSHKLYLPLTQMLECDETGAYCIPNLSVSDIKFGTGLDSAGEARIISVDMELRASAQILCGENITYIADAYSTYGTANLETEQKKTVSSFKKTQKSVSATGEIKYGEIESIVYVRANAKIVRSRYEDSKVYAEGICDAVILAKTSVGGYGTYNQSITFELSADKDEDSDIFMTADVGYTEISRIENGFTYDIGISVGVYEIKTEDLSYISSVSEAEIENESENSPLIIYYHDKDETLWDIAKSHHVSVESIEKANNISAEDFSEKRFIIIPR